MPANNDKASKKIESLIAEPLALRLGIDRTTALPSSTKLNSIAQRPYTQLSLIPETDAVAAALRAICRSATTRLQFQWQGRAHRLLGPDPTNSGHGTQLITTRPGAFIGAQIVVEPVDNEGQHIYVKYALVKNGKHVDGEPRYFFECEGNPTTLLTGNNVLPVTVRNAATGLEEAYPSSSHRAMTTVNRALFVFLEQLSRQVTGSQAALFGPETQRIIASGDFDIVHIQWCCYFPAEVSRFLRMLVAIYGPLVSTEEGFSTVAKQLGLDFAHITDKKTRVTGVLFEKRYGANAVWSVVAYNKQKRLAHMKQGETLDPDEEELIKHNVRLDMTAHGPAIIQIINDAVRALRKHRETVPTFLASQFTNEFLTGEPQKTMRWLEFAVFVLSHRMVDGRIVRRSFENYLVPKIITKVLHLDLILGLTVERLQAFAAFDHPVAQWWHKVERFDKTGWRSHLGRLAGCGATTVDELRKEWLPTWGIDISHPYAFYRDLLTYGPVSLLSAEARKALLAARARNDGGEALRLLANADRNFFAEMIDVVKATLSRDPTLLRAKVAGEVKKGLPGPKVVLPTTSKALASPDQPLTAVPVESMRGPPSVVPGAATVASKSTAKPATTTSDTAATEPTRPRRRSRNWLIANISRAYGVGPHSSEQELILAQAQIRQRLNHGLPDREQRDVRQLLKFVHELITRRGWSNERRNATRKANKEWKRGQRMKGVVKPGPKPKEV